MDVAIIYAQDPIETANIASRQMSVFFMFGPVTFLGGALVSLNLASREYINPLYARITAVVFLIVILAMFYSSINLADPGNHNIPSTIMPAFAGISIAQFFIVIWNLMVGMKMMKNCLSNQKRLDYPAIRAKLFPKIISPPCHKGDL